MYTMITEFPKCFTEKYLNDVKYAFDQFVEYYSVTKSDKSWV